MKARVDKETECLSSNSKGIFKLDCDKCRGLDSTEKDLLIETYIQPALENESAKRDLINVATEASNNGEIIFKSIANKKNVPIEKISNVFRKAIDKSEDELFKVANSIIKLVNSTPTVEGNTEALTKDHFTSEEKDYIDAIRLLCQELKRKNIKWFLKIVGYSPTLNQTDMINDYFSKCETEERIAENTKSMVKESIDPLNTMISENKNSVDALKVKVEKLENDIQGLDMRCQQLSDELSAKIKEIENKLENELDQQTSNERLKGIINELEKKASDQYSELSKKIVDIDFIKAVINETIEPFHNKLSRLSHNTDNLANSLTKMILHNKNSLITENKDIDELKASVVELKQQIQEINWNNKTNTDEENSGLYIEKGKKLSGNLAKCDNIDIFGDLMTENLKDYNISAKYIKSVLLSDTVPLFCGFNSREVATIVSISLCGELPYIISVPNNYNDIGSIADICKNTDTGVILIEDLLGTMNERLIFGLLRAYRRNRAECRDKGMIIPYIFLSCESTEDFKLLPLSIFNHVTVVQCPDYIKCIDYNKLDLGDAKEILFSDRLFEINSENIQFKSEVSKSSLPDVYYQVKKDIISHDAKTLLDNEIRYILPEEEVQVFQNE